jgi:hypothetical protein
MRNKPLSITISCITVLAAVACVAYYLLFTDNFLHISIASIIHASHHLNIKSHLLILGLLPIYIAGMIFGAALIGLYLGSKIEYLFFKSAKNKQ